LNGFKSEEAVENDPSIVLVKEIKDLKLSGDSLYGTFAQDQLLDIYHHGELVHYPTTREIPFFFSTYKDRILLTIMEKKAMANNMANQFSKILFISTGKILEAIIEPKTFRKFHESNFEDAKVIFFDGVDIPNIEKLSLYGSALGDTSIYEDYLKHGEIWYIVLKSRKYGIIVGVTRNCVVTIFSKATEEDFVNYVKGEIFPLIK
jgi:hypothetical protein